MKIQTNLFDDQDEKNEEEEHKTKKKNKEETKEAHRRKLGLMLIISLLLPLVFYVSARAGQWWRKVTGPQVYEYGEVGEMRGSW